MAMPRLKQLGIKNSRKTTDSVKTVLWFFCIVQKKLPKNKKYFIKVYQFTSFEKEKGIGLCKNMNGIKAEIKNINKKFEDYKYKKVTEEQLEILKYNMENAEWISQKECENAN